MSWARSRPSTKRFTLVTRKCHPVLLARRSSNGPLLGLYPACPRSRPNGRLREGGRTPNDSLTELGGKADDRRGQNRRPLRSRNTECLDPGYDGILGSPRRSE